MNTSPVQCNVNSVEVSSFPNKEPECQRIIIQELCMLLCCLLEEINVYEQSVDHWRQLWSVDLQSAKVPRFRCQLHKEGVRGRYFAINPPDLRRGQS